jgi:hypothetical protein
MSVIGRAGPRACQWRYCCLSFDGTPACGHSEGSQSDERFRYSKGARTKLFSRIGL